MGVLHSLPATPADNVATYASPLQHGCCIHQLPSLLGNSSHHLHSLQVTSARRRPLQQHLFGWGPQFKGSFLVIREGTLSKSFNTDVAGTSTSRRFPRYTCTAPVHGNPMREIKEPDWKGR